MATLLHLDSSLNGDNSTSRAVATVFRQAWESQHPEGKVIYRDLAADPLPHIDAAAFYAGYTDPAERTPEQQAAFALRETLIQELEEADAVLIGAPMHNYSIPSTLKAWLDHVIVVGRTVMTEQPSAAGKPVTVVASRGGSFAPGTPQEGREYVLNYLRMLLGDFLGLETDFIVPELTMAPAMPAMAELIPLFEASRTKAHQDAEAKGKALATRLAS
ncbi:FMN-dependent NADH-azoreductase [Streptomyces gobiensis]|uniref:FMN-dependent NADH-azoreductase n=1 Tax=Streptomyces gobiensis TaxID=2875706 RepID=UPI001E3C024A|nr:NAD(P)H-dependent oxidoreductase [Streptomyces gobiensis]UGY92612.1 NAD(P)H-dependent oxidoreductase [Streptomyces gobiensis]